MAVVAAVAAGASVVAGAVGANQAKQAAKGARRDKKRAEAELETIKNKRATIINPYESTKDLSGLAKDLSQTLSNPFAQLSVATQAAEIQMEQADISLANTLDTLRATGASAGGATALAQAALQSKQGISAGIEQQEAQNEKLRAQGEANLQSQKAAEQQRLQSIAISEGQRVQASITQAQQNIASANQAKAQAWGGVASSIGGIGAAAAGN
jgi:hypothetical protein